MFAASFQAMISSVADPDYNYERLEFIGDTVLKFLCGAYLYLEFLDISVSNNECCLNEGFHHRLRYGLSVPHSFTAVLR